MARFYDGQPVVCINTTLRPGFSRMGLTWPTLGSRYTVRGYANPGMKFECVLLHEIKNRVVRYNDGTIAEAGFWEARFAPITDEQVRGIIEEAVKGPKTVRQLEDAE